MPPYRVYRAVLKNILFLLSVLSVVWIVFLKYIYSSSGKMVIPLSWKISHSCDVRQLDVHKWDVDFRKMVSETSPIVYNVSTRSCKGHFFSDFYSNIKKLLNTKLVQESPCLDVYLQNADNQANHDNRKHDRDHIISEHKSDGPVILTAASSDHYHESQALFESIHKTLTPLYRDVKIIFYDIGLTAHQHAVMKKYCRCEVRKFPFSDFEPHIRELRGYAWKPLMILEVLKEHDFVMYLDACIRFSGFWIKNRLDKIMQRTKKTGIQLQKSPRWIVSNQTKLDTFIFLEEEECMFSYPELESGLIVLYRNSFLMNAIIRPWVACALTENCMSNPFPQFLKPCSKDVYKMILWARCHRFDQSVLNIILIRIFNRYRKLIEFDGYRTFTILRGDKANYFPE